MDKIYYQNLEEFPHKNNLSNSPLYYHINDLFHRTKRLHNKDSYNVLTKITELDNFNNYFKNCYGISIEKDGAPIMLGRNAKIISNKIMVVNVEDFIRPSVSIFRRGCPFKNFGFTSLFLLGSFYVYKRYFETKK